MPVYTGGYWDKRTRAGWAQWDVRRGPLDLLTEPGFNLTPGVQVFPERVAGPLRARYNYHDWFQPSQQPVLLDVVPPAPFVPIDWPNPTRRRVQGQMWQDSTVRLIGFDAMYGEPGQVPARDLPLPVTRVRGAVDLRTWTYEVFRELLTESPPIALRWDNPRHRAVQRRFLGPAEFTGLIPGEVRPNVPIDWRNPSPRPPSRIMRWLGPAEFIGFMPETVGEPDRRYIGVLDLFDGSADLEGGAWDAQLPGAEWSGELSR